MKRNPFPVLLEQLVMVLTLAVAAAVCLRLFVAADQISRQSRQLDRAVLAAQTAVEVLKSGESVEDDPSDDLLVTVTPLSSQVPGLAKAEISVFDEAGTLVYTLTAGWQEVVP